MVLLAACDQPEELPVEPVGAPDGVLDCEVEGITFEAAAADIPADALGKPTPRLAAMSAASEHLRPGDGVVEVDGMTFSIVRAGKEVGILHVDRAARGFVVPRMEGCVAEDADEVFTLP